MRCDRSRQLTMLLFSERFFTKQLLLDLRVTTPARPRRMVVIRQSSQITLSAHRSLRSLGAVRKAATPNRKDPARNLRIGLQPWSLAFMLGCKICCIILMQPCSRQTRPRPDTELAGDKECDGHSWTCYMDVCSSQAHALPVHVPFH